MRNAPDGCSDQESVSGPNRSISAVTLGKDRMHHQKLENRTKEPKTQLPYIERDQTKSPMHGPIIEDDLIIEDLEWPNDDDNLRVLLPKDSCPNRYKKKSFDDLDVRRQQELNRWYDPQAYQPIITIHQDGVSSVTSSVVDFDELPSLRGIWTPVAGSRTDLFSADEHLGKPDKSFHRYRCFYVSTI